MALTVVQKSVPFGSGTFRPKKNLFGSLTGSFSVDYLVKCANGITYNNAGDLMNAMQSENVSILPGKTFSDMVISSLDLRHTAEAGKKVWLATAHYESNPVYLPVEVQMSTTHYREVVEKDALGKAVMNSAKQPFASAIEEDRGRPRIEITKRFRPEDWAFSQQAHNYLFHRSSTHVSFTSDGQQFNFDAGRLYCTEFKTPLLYEPLKHYAVTLAFEVETKSEAYGKPWVRQVQDRGYQFYAGGIEKGGSPIPFTTAKGVMHGQPHFLDGKGDKLADKADPVFIDVQSIPDADFNLLRIFPGQ